MLSNYQLQYQLPLSPVVVGEPGYTIPMDISTILVGDVGYEKALIKINVIGPEGAIPQVTTAENSYFDVVNGFVITPDYTQNTSFDVVFDMAGEYSINVKLVDINDSEAVINENIQTIQVEPSIEYVEAKDAVVVAETSKLQSDVDSARLLVNNLPMDSFKTDLENRLNSVQEDIDIEVAYQLQLTEATDAVILAETSKLQSDVDAARVLVNELREADKGVLGGRLDLVQNHIDVEVAYQIQLTEATDSVITAETTLLQSDVNSARLLVNALRESDKIQLNGRLDIVQNAINAEAGYEIQLVEATNAVFNAETTKSQSDLDTARTLVAALREEDKTDLDIRLDTLQDEINIETAYQLQLTEATNAVVKAEGTKLQVDVDTAIVLVNTLRPIDKTSLSARLSIVQDAINVETAYQTQLTGAINSVVIAENTKTQVDVDSARTLVDLLREADKITLNSRLDVVQNYIDDEASYIIQLSNATSMVETAENTMLQTDVDSARTLVAALREEDKTALNSRLDVVQNIINDAIIEAEYQLQLTEATDAVEMAEGSQLQADVDSARVLVNALREADKTALNSRLNVVQNEINIANGTATQIAEATSSVELAESTKSQVDIDAAQILVSALVDGSIKSGLQSRINTVIAFNTIKAEANEAINAYELTIEAFNAGDIDAFTVAYANLDAKRIEAFNSFNSLPEGTDKEALKNRYFVAENSQYAAYKTMLLGFAGNKQLEPVKIENVGGNEPYKVTFKGVLPGHASTAWLFYPEGYLRTQTGNMLHPNDMPTEITDKIAVGSDSIFVSNQYIQGGQFVIVFEMSGEYHKVVYEVAEDGKSIIEINQQAVIGIDQPAAIWTVSRQSLIDKINEAQQLLIDHEVGLNIGEVSQESHDTLQAAIDAAVIVRDTVELITIIEVNNAVSILQQANSIFAASVSLTNRETITESIDEANMLINSTTIGDQIGQVTQIAMDNLIAEVANALVVRNDKNSTQEQLDAANSTLIIRINEFKAVIITPVSFANTKMTIYEVAAEDFFTQILKKKITT